MFIICLRRARNRPVNLCGTLIPFWYFDLRTEQGRKGYVENFQMRFGRFLSWLPFILIMAIGCADTQTAIWSAFGVSLFYIIFNFYYSSWKPETHDRILILEAGMTVSYLVQGVIATTQGLDCQLIGPINTTSLLIVTILSLMICYPFTIQYARAKVTPEIARKPRFFQINQILTLVWVGIFSIMVACSWITYFYLRDKKQDWKVILISTVFPIILPLVGAMSMPHIASWARSKLSVTQEEIDVQHEGEEYVSLDP